MSLFKFIIDWRSRNKYCIVLAFFFECCHLHINIHLVPLPTQKGLQIQMFYLCTILLLTRHGRVSLYVLVEHNVSVYTYSLDMNRVSVGQKKLSVHMQWMSYHIFITYMPSECRVKQKIYSWCICSEWIKTCATYEPNTTLLNGGARCGV